MIKEGLSLPPVPEDKPDSEPSAVPEGVKMLDDEIANGISLKTAYAVTLVAATASQSIRNDVALMFMGFLAEKAMTGAELKTFMRKRGWIRVPPYYYLPGLPQNR